MITPAEIGELVAEAFDRLGDEYQGFEAMGAVLLIELRRSDPEDDEPFAGGDVIVGSTSDRAAIVAGILQIGAGSIVTDVEDE